MAIPPEIRQLIPQVRQQYPQLAHLPDEVVAQMILQAMQEQQAPLVLGDPDGSLSHSREEAKVVAELYGTTAYVGSDALERLVWERGRDAGILHLSSHGVYNDRSPLFSRVLLAPDDEEDGNLEVYEIYNRGLNLAKADLVVLSACQTNVGELSRGDDIVGLSRALIYAGTPSVIASLWSVSDESTRVLMEKFYTHLREGMSKAEALRAAQIEMIAGEKYTHPYYWAAFGVTGDPGIGKSIPSTPRTEKTPMPTESGAEQATQEPASAPVAAPTVEKPGGGICGLPLAAIGVLIVGGMSWRRWGKKCPAIGAKRGERS